MEKPKREKSKRYNANRIKTKYIIFSVLFIMLIVIVCGLVISAKMDEIFANITSCWHPSC